MNLFTHYLLAKRLEELVQPDNPAEYAWGAVIPDVRYMAGIPRKQTHLEIAQVKGWLDCFPARRSFVQGYLVHCLLDRIDVAHVVESAFPMRLLRKKISLQQAVMLVEFYYLRSAHAGGAIFGEHNEILEGLGVRAEQTAAYAGAVREYLGKPSFEGAVMLARRMGLLEDSRVEKYLSAARSMQKNGLALLPMLWSVRNANFERRGARLLRAALDEKI